MRLDVYEEVSNGSAALNQNTNPLRANHHYPFGLDDRDGAGPSHGSYRRFPNESDVQRSAIPFISDIPVIGNLFSDNASDKKKLNLLVFLTPHVVRTRDDLRSLALDERQKYADALGRREMHQMPMDEYKQLYQPTFSVPVSPAQDLKDRGSTMAPMPSSGGGFGGSSGGGSGGGFGGGFGSSPSA